MTIRPSTFTFALLLVPACMATDGITASLEAHAEIQVGSDAGARRLAGSFAAAYPPAADAPDSSPPDPREGLIVHEWGTFTSVAGVDGVAVDWRPLLGGSDLPEFVYRRESPGLRRTCQGKCAFPGNVRMETPVIYFYSDRELEVDVRVQFPAGTITEWFPRVASIDEHGIDWGTFKVRPSESSEVVLPTDDQPDNHYYAARETDADLVRICDATGYEYDKFLFYRGVGSFDLSLRATMLDGSLHLSRDSSSGVGVAIVFESRDGHAGFEQVDLGSGAVIVERPSLDDSVDDVTAALETLLVADGLYTREAQAMIATWREHWFEDGLRVFYLLPRSEIDERLPLEVSPTPTELVRTIVGRVELITPEMETSARKTVRHASGSRAAWRQLQSDHGRFAEPVLRRLLANPRDRAERRALRAALAHVGAS